MAGSVQDLAEAATVALSSRFEQRLLQEEASARSRRACVCARAPAPRVCGVACQAAYDSSRAACEPTCHRARSLLDRGMLVGWQSPQKRPPRRHAAAAAAAAVPAVVVTGFLGSGKTTLVQHLLDSW
jgi:hypothetical protein